MFVCVFYFDFHFHFFVFVRALSIISFHLLLTLVSTFDLKCQWNYEVCNVEQLDCTSSGQIVESVNEIFSTWENVTAFSVIDQVCHYIPQKFEYFFPNLNTITVINSGLRTISQSDLAPFPKLTEINLSRNKLEYIDGDLFSRNANIKSVTLEDTNLRIIDGPILASLEQLNYIKIGLQCFEEECWLSNCIRETTKLFAEKCEFDSKYPGFRKYLHELIDTAESCKNFSNTANL